VNRQAEFLRERREAWDQYAAAASMDSSVTTAEQAARFADELLEARDNRFPSDGSDDE